MNLDKKEREIMSDYLEHTFSADSIDLISAIDELPFWSAPFGLRLLEKIEYQENITGLDIGCGMGFPLLEVANRIGKSGKMYGIDPWVEAIKRVNKKIEYFNISNAFAIEAKAENLPFDDNYFNLIMSNNGLNNVEDFEVSLKECARVAKQNAQLVYTYNLPDTMIEFYRIFKEVLKTNFLPKEIEAVDEHIYSKRRPIEDTVEIFHRNGFQIMELSNDSFNYRFANADAMFNHSLIKFWFLPEWKKIVPVHLRKRIFSEIELEMNKEKFNNEYINLTIPFAIIKAIRD